MRATLKAALADRLIMGMPMSMRHMQGMSQVVHTAMLVMAEASHRVYANLPMRFALTSDGRNRLMSNTTPLFTPRGLPRQAGQASLCAPGVASETVMRSVQCPVAGLLLALHVGHVCQEARQDLVVVLEERLPLVEGIDLSHVLVRQREIEEVDVVRDVRGCL